MVVLVDNPCPVCQRKRGYSYVGPFYSEGEVHGICPWCIKDGSAARAFGGEFQDSAACEPVSSSEALDELLHRTPGYNGWQQEQWLSHCGDFCAYLGSVGYEDISEFAEDLAADVPLEMMERLSKERSPTGYLFRCLTCGKSRLAWDSD